MYDLSDVVAVEALSSVPVGTSILLSGPAMTGKEELVREILSTGASAGDGAVAVTTGGRARDVVDDLRSRSAEVDPRAICAIDCRDAEDHRRTDGETYVHSVGSPSDMTGIGIGISDCFERLQDAGFDRGRLGLVNLSTMLTYSDRETVFKFCHVLSSRLDAAGFLGVFTIDASAHDDQTLQVIKQAFDGLVEIREREGTREARALGIRPDPSGWVEL